MTTITIHPQAFVERMEAHWTGPLGNVASDSLRKAWQQMATAFEKHITAHGDPDWGNEWTILQPATGSGKSQGAAVYCSMLAKYETTAEHPGVLIVVRHIADADGMADTINGLAGRTDYAKAYHSESGGPGVLESLRGFPVLVICHRAYEMALDALGQEGTIRRTWPYFHGWGLDTRKLVVVDECLDIVEESRGELDGLRLTLGAIPESVRRLHPGAVMAVEELVSIMSRMGDKTLDKGERLAETILIKQAMEGSASIDITGLRAALRLVPFDQQVRMEDKTFRGRQAQEHDDRLRSVDTILRSWVYYAKVAKAGHTLNTARLLIPEETKGAVVLDATASSNLIYQLFKDARVIKAPEGVRNYRNVRLHVNRDHRVGKMALLNDGADLIVAVFKDLDGRIAGRSAFVVSHKQVEATVARCAAKFEVKTGHWNAITGSNLWRDCSVAVVIGLPYRPDTWSANTFMALQGVQTTDWLRAGLRPFGDHKDIRAALRRGQVVTDVVQAVNRIRCRKVIDGEGNCPEADVFLLLPPDAEGDAILAGIVDLMKGIDVQPWTLTTYAPTAKKRGRKAGTGEVARSVLAAHLYLKGRLPGKTTKVELRGDLQINDKGWEALVASAADLQPFGIEYRVEGKGRGSKAYFHKA